MRQVSLIQDLKERGLVAQFTDEEALVERMSQGSIALYCGFDPTADSLHLGHLVPLLCLKRFQQAGHHPIALVGGATGMIGDPSFKATERSLNTLDTVTGWVEKIKRQVSPFLDFDNKANPARIVNNYEWFGQMDVLTFLRDIGKHFSVNSMIGKESVKQRINRHESGISFTEFAYSLLQSYDFASMNSDLGVVLQIGGSDQWGNITSGIDLTRRMNKQQVFGMTVPLITKADGTKFGKTEGGAIWLDPSKTSPYKFYQFWLSTADADVYRFLRFFTFLTEEEIQKIEDADRASSEAPIAQRILAEEATRLVHGHQQLESAQFITNCLFANDISKLDKGHFDQLAQDGMPSSAAVEGDDLQQVLIRTGLASSRGQARTHISSNAVMINGVKVTEPYYEFSDADKLFNRYTLIRRGKKNYSLVVWN
ncbi:tyrosine--tRNA ligase [Photobacterium leiognathi]|uniref:tyrosine--tRNA ligase n=1 Tax=Photobacterium leiognathi TaxID=553611 RepID=UPI001EDE270F|nr:tyrosine--tRNA ligase [Photobacterium leiognathi]MCG3884423.1 tyrosine--tRNA ligase [Photobacterium leiognathi]